MAFVDGYKEQITVWTGQGIEELHLAHKQVANSTLNQLQFYLIGLQFNSTSTTIQF